MIQPPAWLETQRHRGLERRGKTIPVFLRAPVFPVVQFAFAVLCVSVSLWFNCLSALAQAPEIGGLLPCGGPRGQVTTLRIDGKNLAGAKLFVDGRGVSVKSVQPSADSLTAEVQVDSSASLGPHEVRVVTSKGVSNGSRFWVDLQPNRVLEHPIREDEAAVPLDGNAREVINGRIAAKAGRDRFQIEAVAGEMWSFECFAERIRSKLDPVLEIRDDRGVLIRLVESTWENDPRFVHTFAKAGRYTLIVRDSEYNGGPNYTYRLTAGRQTFVTSFAPRGGQPGGSASLSLTLADKSACMATVPVPADPQASPESVCWAETRVGQSVLALPLLVGSEPVSCASDTEAIQALPALPAAVDGTFTRFPKASFRFHATSGAKYLFDLYGRRIGSRIDGQIRVLNSAGKVAAENDDLSVLTKDARVEFAPPAEGDYVIEVKNVEEVTGSDCYYRLRATRIVPDFRLAIATDRLVSPAGGTIAVPVTVERIGGFAGSVEIRVDGLPAGVKCSGGLIPAGKTSVELTLTSAVVATPAASPVRVIGTAMLDGKRVERDAPAWEQYEHRSIDLLLSVEYSYTRPHHLWNMLLCAVADRVDPITVETAAPTYDLAPGGKLEIPVRIVRHAGSAAEVKLEARNLPAKVTVAALTIPAGQTEGKLVFTAAADAPADLTNLIITAKHGSTTSLAPALRLTVTRK